MRVLIVHRKYSCSGTTIAKTKSILVGTSQWWYTITKTIEKL